MTKVDEMKILRDCAKKLGTDSYCGPWLSGILFEVHSLMLSDFLPRIRITDTIQAAEKRAQEIITQAENEAEGILRVAKRKVSQQNEYVTQQKVVTIRQLQSALDALGG